MTWMIDNLHRQLKKKSANSGLDLVQVWTRGNYGTFAVLLDITKLTLTKLNN